MISFMAEKNMKEKKAKDSINNEKNFLEEE